MKPCGRCKEELPFSSFRFKNKEKGNYQSYCIECNKQKNKEHYQANKDDYVLKAKLYKQENGRGASKQDLFIYEYKLLNPCVDCGERDPVVLTFDHRIPSEKVFSIGSDRNKYELELVRVEVAKCDVRCANCHARRTALQFNWYQDPAYKQIRDNVHTMH